MVKETQTRLSLLPETTQKSSPPKRFGRRKLLEDAVIAGLLVAVPSLMDGDKDPPPPSDIPLMQATVNTDKRLLLRSTSRNTIQIKAQEQQLPYMYTIVPIGDSIADGYCTSPANQGMMADLLSDIVSKASSNKKAVSVQASGRIGTTKVGAASSDVLTLLKSPSVQNKLRQYNQQPFASSIFLISAGGDDVFNFFTGIAHDIGYITNFDGKIKPATDTLVTTYQRNISEILAVLSKVSGGSVQGVLTLLPNVEDLPAVSSVVDKIPFPSLKDSVRVAIQYATLEINKAMLAFAQQHKLAYINMYSHSFNKTLVCPDGLHPNPEGYRAIANLVSQVIEVG